MASMRAIEHGRYLARAANTGISGFIDAQGGISPPLVILSTRPQPLAHDRQYQDVLAASDDCVLVWATRGFGDIAAWHRSVWQSHLGASFQTVAPETRSRIGSYDITLQDVRVGTRTIATPRFLNENIRSTQRCWNAASPTLSTSSMMSTSGSRCAAIAKPRR